MPASLKLYVPLFSITLILSAFLLFSVQPLFGKMVLPLLGGAPGVWNTAMMFFQAMLLGGYAYAHLTSKYLGIRTQAVLHLGLLALCLLVLPIAIPAGWQNPPVTENPVPWLLGLLALAVGGPFFVIAGTAPMLQRWFSTTQHPDAHNPYFLYAASNLGSMAALLLYPLAIEPLLGVQQQSQFWMVGYLLLAVLVAMVGFISRNGVMAITAPDPQLPANNMTPTNKMRLVWLLLSFIPSSLMLGVTTYVTTDIAAVPLLWVLPLALYLLTFIIVFSRICTLSIARAYRWQALGLIAIALLFIRDPFALKAITVSIHLIAFFFCALTCHLALAHRRPTPQHLTEFYLIMSLGGVLGGIFNSLLAPLLFVIPLEYALVLGLSVLAPFISGDKIFNRDDFKKDYKPALVVILLALFALMPTKSAAIMIMVLIAIGVALIKLSRRNSSWFAATLLIILALDPGFNWDYLSKALHMERNFFGVIRVTTSDRGGMRMLLHGTTLHGTQALDEAYRLSPISYYAAGTPGGQVFGMLSDIQQGQEPQTVAMLGLGLGSTACFFEKGRDFVFYEIDPAMKRIAEDKNLFTYLSDCGSPYRIIMGDARLRITEAPDASYDMIFLDAFSSDSIPMHLLTKEAFDVYFRKLKPHGLIVVHISNRFLDLSPVVVALAEAHNAVPRFSHNYGRLLAQPDIMMQGSIFAMMTRNTELISIVDHRYTKWKSYSGDTLPVWTDDYANILAPMLLRITKEPNWMGE